MNNNVYDYSELKEDIFDDIKAEMEEGGSSFLSAASIVIHNSIELAIEKIEINNMMVYLIIALKALELNELMGEVKMDITKIIEKNMFDKYKDQFLPNNFEVIKKDLATIINKL